jgi:2-hydroxycyclohexanecarboxyl-CoA dehydrogenase
MTVPPAIIRCILVVTPVIALPADRAYGPQSPATVKGKTVGPNEKIAIVTGAGQGIGRAIAERLATHGATVIVTDINEEAAAQTARAISARATSASAIAMAADVTSAESVAAMTSRVRSQFGRIDVLVNNAGWDKAGPFTGSDPADWDQIIRINLYGVLNTSKAVLPVMAEQGRGTVVNIASDAGRVGSSGEAVYSAAKGGVIAFTKSTAREMARYQVTANCVCPGPADTALFASLGGDDPKLRNALIRAIPLRRLADPADVAAAVAFLASDDAAFITGQTLSVSGGLTMS